MSYSVYNLQEACFKDDFSYITNSVIADYGFKNCKNDEEYSNLLGLYQGIIKCIGCDVEELHKACVNNKLKEFIKKIHGKHQSGYYKWFLKNESIVQNFY